MEPESQPATVIHTVQSGEWPAAIAANYGVAVNYLMAVNDLQAGAVIHPGQVLTIPGSATVPVDDHPEDVSEPAPIDICQDPRYDTYVAEASDVLDAVELSKIRAQEVWEYFAIDPSRMFDERAAAIFLVTLAPRNAEMARSTALEPPPDAQITH